MARTQSRTPDRERVLHPVRRLCPACVQSMRVRYENRRTLVTLTGTQRLRLKVGRCEAEGCARFHKSYRPEAEGALALPQHEFGLDVVALVGTLRHREHRSVPEIHVILRERGVSITDDGRAPLDAAGLRLKARLEKVAGSLDRVVAKGGARCRAAARSRGSST